MTKYILNVSGYAYATVEVDIDDDDFDPDDTIFDRVTEAVDMPYLCAHCAGWGRSFSLELGGDWEWDRAEVRLKEEGA